MFATMHTFSSQGLTLTFPSSPRRGGAQPQAERRGGQPGATLAPNRPPRLRLRSARRIHYSGFALSGSRFAPSSARRGMALQDPLTAFPTPYLLIQTPYLLMQIPDLLIRTCPLPYGSSILLNTATISPWLC